MTTRRINWTARKRITRDHASVAVVAEPEGPRVKADIRLASYELPGDARVVVEAYKQTTWVRYEFGTVALTRPSGESPLGEFGDPHGVLFRVKVLGTGADEGRILAEADQIRATDPSQEASDRQPLLIPQGRDLGSEVWRLELEEGSQGPQFFVNNKLSDWRSVAISPQFVWFVYPELLRKILMAALDSAVSEDDEEDWQSKWLQFASLLPGVPDVPGESDLAGDRARWVEEVVQAFCRSHRFMERFADRLVGG